MILPLCQLGGLTVFVGRRIPKKSSREVSFRSSAKRYNDDLWWQDQRGEQKLTRGILLNASLDDCPLNHFNEFHFWDQQIKKGNSHKLALLKNYAGFHPLEGFLRCRILGVV